MIRSIFRHLVAVLVVYSTALAIDIDRLTPNTDASNTLSVAGIGMSSAILYTSTAILGGTRDVSGTVTGSDDGSALTGRILASRYRYSQDTETFGSSRLIYDGDLVIGNINPAGLGGIDFTADDATALVLENVASDHPFKFTITVFDKNNPGQFVSFTKEYSLPTPGDNNDPRLNEPPTKTANLVAPFAQFSPSFDFKSVGAVVLDIDGTTSNSEALDVSFGKFKTNGRCSHIPSNGLVVDLCGVCNGDNSTCSDCVNVPNGPALPGTPCDTGDLGTCAASTYTGTPPLNCQCPDINPQSETCNSLDDNCDGQTDNVPGLNDSCSAGVGECKVTGVKICSTGGLVCGVTPGSPITEVCDAKDNDCDGTTDEEFGLGDSCSVGVGACQNTGTKVCSSDGNATCSVTPGTPSPEVCDGVDNNCDGTIDEGLGLGDSCSVGVGACSGTGTKVCGAGGVVNCSAAPGTPSAEACDAIDNNCDGNVDEGFGVGSTCSVGVGQCASTGSLTCSQGGTAVCSVVPKSASPEVCDGVDNDCDGAADEGLGVGASCTVGLGVCSAPGQLGCSQNGGVSCQGTPGTPTTEVCDGLDNDCDGAVDEGFEIGTQCVAGLGACKAAGTMACGVAGQATCNGPTLAPSEEVCDKVDNDCDGEVDEGVVDRCGVCGGDGSSCLECNSVDITQTLFALDGGAKDQEQLIVRAMQLYRVTPAGKKDKKYIASSLSLAHVLQIKNWTLSWTLPQVSTQCKNLEFCVSTSNAPILSEYNEGADQLLEIGLGVITKLKKARGGVLRGREASLERSMRKQFSMNIALAESVPVAQTSCT